MRSLRVLHVIGGGDTGGAMTHLLALLSAMERAGSDVHLLCLGEGGLADEAAHRRLSLAVLPMSSPRDPRVLGFGRVWLNGKGALVAWPQSGGWAWVCLRCQQDAMGLFRWLSGSKGNIASPGTFSELAAWLKAQGWQQTPAVGALSQWINAGANWVSILVLPVSPDLLPTESGVRY